MATKGSHIYFQFLGTLTQQLDLLLLTGTPICTGYRSPPVEDPGKLKVHVQEFMFCLFLLITCLAVVYSLR